MSASSSQSTISGGPIRRAMVVGTGVSGRAATRLLKAEGVDVVVVEPRQGEVAREEGVWADPCIDPGAATEVLDTVDAVIPSPGVPPTSALIVDALSRGVAVWSEPELAFRLRPRRLLAVTGTNGKTSTTELVAAMLQASGTPAQACGNIGVPLCDAVLDTAASVLLVAELSSFQLHHCHQLRPEVAALLNLAPDHLDWHSTMDDYAAAKARIWQAQSPDDWAVANADDALTATLQKTTAPGKQAAFSAQQPVVSGVGVVDDQLAWFEHSDVQPLVPLTVLATRKAHHVANIAAAATIARIAQATDEAIATVAQQFVAGPHRGETVATIAGVRYVNDSKATNPHAAAAALGSAGSVVWIAGGVAKGVDLASLGQALSQVRHAVLIGESAETLAAVCRDAHVSQTLCDSLDDAVAVAAEHAQPGDTVLLAPACASFDQFRDYAERGVTFVRAVHALAARAGEVAP